MKHFTRTAFAVAIAVSGTLGQAIAADWDMPVPYSDKTFHTVNIAEFAKEVKEATNGGLNITIHSAGSLIKHPEIKNAVRSNQVPLGEFFLSRLSNEDAAFGIDSQPFLATSYDGAAKLWAAQKPAITTLLAKQNLTKGEVKTTADLSGLKFRAYNAALEKFATLAGAAPTQVEAADIPQAFSTGQVEAMITSPSTGANTKAWDYVSHYTPINAWVPKNIVVVNKAAFDALDAATQTAVTEAAAKAEARGWEMSKAETDAKTAILLSNGMSVVEPSAELLAGLKEIGAKMQKDWQANASDEAKAIAENFAK